LGLVFSRTVQPEVELEIVSLAVVAAATERINSPFWVGVTEVVTSVEPEASAVEVLSSGAEVATPEYSSWLMPALIPVEKL
jgi:hypothetical protein